MHFHNCFIKKEEERTHFPSKLKKKRKKDSLWMRKRMHPCIHTCKKRWKERYHVIPLGWEEAICWRFEVAGNEDKDKDFTSRAGNWTCTCCMFFLVTSKFQLAAALHFFSHWWRRYACFWAVGRVDRSPSERCFPHPIKKPHCL